MGECLGARDESNPCCRSSVTPDLKFNIQSFCFLELRLCVFSSQSRLLAFSLPSNYTWGHGVG